MIGANPRLVWPLEQSAMIGANPRLVWPLEQSAMIGANPRLVWPLEQSAMIGANPRLVWPLEQSAMIRANPRPVASDAPANPTTETKQVCLTHPGLYDFSIAESLRPLTVSTRPSGWNVRERWARFAAPHLSVRRAVLAAILLVALAMRLWSLQTGIPHAVGIDEPAVVDRALRILRSGDWNPRIFDYPTLVIYLHALVALVRFMAGATRGEWSTLAGFDISDVYVAGRLVSACIGTATVWLTYRLGREVASDRVGLIAAAQLAVLPMHVRESHFILTDVPVTALTTLTVYLASRTEQTRYWVSGVAAGLAGAAKYNGGVVLIAALVGVARLRAPISARLRMAAIATAAAGAAFLIATPFVVLDLPTFLNSFAAQMSRLAQMRETPEPVWMIYLKHFALSSRLWLPLAAAGLVIVVGRRASRARWLPILAFGSVYFYVLATHSLVFARYALPLTPVICLLAAAGMEAVARLLTGIPGLPRRGVHAVALFLLVTPLLVSFGHHAINWNRQAARRDTRQMAAEWIRATFPPGSRLAIENNGPSYLGPAGFDVTGVNLLTDHPIEWYGERRIQYLVVSSAVAWAQGYADAGPRELDVPTTRDRAGPAIRVVRLQ